MPPPSPPPPSPPPNPPPSPPPEKIAIVTSSVTIGGDINDFNETDFRYNLAITFGLALEDIVLSVSENRRSLQSVSLLQSTHQTSGGAARGKSIHRSLQSGGFVVEFQITTRETSGGNINTQLTEGTPASLTTALGVTVQSVTAPVLAVLEWPPPPPSMPPSPETPTAEVAQAAREAKALADKLQFNKDMEYALSIIQLNASGTMIELDVSAGILDQPGLKRWLIFSPATTASEVILQGKGSDEFNPYYDPVGRRLEGQGGTTFRNMPITVLGGNNAPRVQLHKMRFELSISEPAIYIHDWGYLVVQDCVFDRNLESGIRLVSGTLDVAYTEFSNNGNGAARGGALQLLGGAAKIMNSLFVANNASEGGAIYIEACDVAIGNRTQMLGNKANGAATGPAYVASGLNGNSIYSTNGTLRYLLPAPLGYWVGPAREVELFPFGLVGTDVLSVVIKSSNVQEYNPMDRKQPDKRINLAPDFRIDEDYPFPCAEGFFREQDTPEAQDGPQCEAACRAGTHCPGATATPLPCYTASYCPEGSELPISCPKGSWTNKTDLVSSWDCEPCPKGHYCPLNTSEPIPCGIGAFAPTVGYYDCELCPIGYFQDEIGSYNCSVCIEGVYCPLGTTKEPCYPGDYRDLDTGLCINAPAGQFASLGATEPSLCPPG